MYQTSRYMRTYQKEQAVKAVAPRRKFNLIAGIKRSYHTFNEYFGLETTGDKIIYHAFVWFMVLMVLGVMLPSLFILN